MNHLTRNDFAGALRLLAQLEARAGDLPSFAAAALVAVGGFVASEFATLSVWDRATGQRQGLSRPDGRRTAYGRPAGSDYGVALPLFMDGRIGVSIVLHRRGLDFSERDRERLELLRPHLAFLYRQAGGVAAVSPGVLAIASPALAPAGPDPWPQGLTLREGEVMHWLACGKTDADIAALLAISPRTVHKHLEHIYVKLGVETRTAAVMRTLAMGPSVLDGARRRDRRPGGRMALARA